MIDKRINVTKPSLPPLEEFIPYLEKIWSSKILTNSGPFHEELEHKLSNYLGVNQISLLANGTLALMTALQALNVKGEVITTPFTFVATVNAILCTGNLPIFVDIEVGSLNIDPKAIEAAINTNTKAIVATHCYGNPCDTKTIEKIAHKYNLRVIYDAAHAFGVEDSGGSILRHGDLSILSLHATKVFTTFEGGCIIANDTEITKTVTQLRNFGISSEGQVASVGLNAKMSEVHAALGLLQLNYVDALIKKRSIIADLYKKNISKIKGICVVQDTEITKPNYTYFPILIREDYPVDRDTLFKRMADIGVNARKYFFPLITEFPAYKNLRPKNSLSLPNAKKASGQILCLPIYPDLELKNVAKICDFLSNPEVPDVTPHIDSV